MASDPNPSTRSATPPVLTLAGPDILTQPADVLVVGVWSAGAAEAEAPAAGGRRRGRGARVAAPVGGAVVPASGAGVAIEALATLSPGGLTAALAAVGATGRAGELTWLPVPAGSLGARAVAVVGLGAAPDGGPAADPTRTAGTVPASAAELLRRAAGKASTACAGKARVLFALPAAEIAELEAVAEGAALGAYVFDAYRSAGRTGRTPRTPLAAAVIVSPLADNRGQKAAAEAVVARAGVVATAVYRARDLINTPALDLYPQEFADRTTAWFDELSGAAAKAVTVEVLDEQALAAGGYGGLLGVGRGSARPPRLVRIAYRPAKATGHVALVGKGITFDTGGYSMKTAAGMLTMKCDMAGAATVVAAIRAAAELGVRTNITAYACLAENMVSATAIHPSDVLTIRGGTTVQVDNTDAEGRLVLADGLVRAGEDQPDVIVDVATLTGACVVALGLRTAGVMGDAGFSERVVAVGDEVGESFWPLPIPEEMLGKLDSDVADIANVGDRDGGALQAAAFLREFVADGIAWAHLDVAGPAFHDKAPFGYTPKGGTGFGVRTLVALADLAAAGELL
jgi:leucyl aminopeptidase